MLEKPLSLYIVTSAMMFLLEVINAFGNIFIDQNVFFVLQILRVGFLIVTIKKLKEYCDRYDFVEISLIYYANVIFGVLAIVCGVDWLFSSVSTIFSFYGLANYYIWVLVVEVVLFFIAVLFILLREKNSIKIFYHGFFYMLHTISSIYLLNKVLSKGYIEDAYNAFTWFIGTSVIVYIYHLVLNIRIEKEFFRKEENL